MSVAKRHHTIPQFYLRGFAADDLISTVFLPGTQRFLQSVRRASAEMNFYAIDGHPDGPDAFEKVLSEIEGRTAEVFSRIADGVWPLSREDRSTLAFFIALQVVRGPDQRRDTEYIAAQIARLEIGYGGRANMAAWVLRNRGLVISEDEAEVLWQQATRPEGPPIHFLPAVHVEQIVKHSQEIVKHIAGRPWTLVRFEQNSLVTSDTPVGLVPPADHRPEDGIGFATAWGITYPLSRRLGLLMSDWTILAEAGMPIQRTTGGAFDRAEGDTDQMADFFNEWTVSSASLWLYHHPEDERLLPGTLPEPNPTTVEMTGGVTEFSGASIAVDGVVTHPHI